MSEFDSVPADGLDEDPIFDGPTLDEEPLLDDPDLDEPTADELDDPELNAAEAEAEEVDLETGLDEGGETGPSVEPGADGPEGTGIEGADDALLNAAGREDENNSPDLSEEFNTDQSPAAEQGNRDGDEMVSEDHDDAEVAELDGDDLNVDALADDGTDEVSVIDGMPEVIDDSYEEG